MKTLLNVDIHRRGVMDQQCRMALSIRLLVMIAASCSATEDATTRDALGLSVVSPASAASSNGLITSWGTMISRSLGKVSLEVWRPITHLAGPVGDVMLHRLVDRTPPRDSHMHSEGQKEFTLIDREYIRVETGDLIGLHYSDVTTISNEFTFVLNDTACFNKNVFYEAEGLDVLSYPTYRRFTRVMDHISQCGVHLPMYVLRDSSCHIVNAETDERRTHLANGLGKPCWIFQGCGGCELSLTFDTCDVLDLISIHNGNSSSYEPLPIECNTVTNKATCRSRHTNYVYISHNPYVVDKPKVGLGFKSLPKGDDCIHLYADDHGITMDFNNSAPEDCWRITESRQRQRLIIEFSKKSTLYNVSGVVQCPSDLFELRDGFLASSPQLYLPCLYDLRLTSSVVSSGSFLRIVAREAQNLTFHVTIRSVNEDLRNCTVYTVDRYEPTVLTSASYPQSYQPSTSVCWLVTSISKNYRLLMTAIDSDLVQTTHCTHTFVDVKDGRDSDSPTLVKWCGTQVPASVLSTSSSLYIGFVTDHNISHGGFKLAFSVVNTDMCTVRLAHPRNQLLFRSASLAMSNVNSSCCWILENRIPVNHIRLRIQGMTSNQACGSLDVREGRTSTSPSLFTTHGTSTEQLSQEVHGNGRYIYITYTSCGFSSNLSVSFQSVSMSEPVGMVTSTTETTTSTSVNAIIPIHNNLSPSVSLGGPEVSESLQPAEKIKSDLHLAPIIAIPVAMVTIIAILIIILVLVHRRRKVGLTTVPIFDRTHPCIDLPMAAASPKLPKLVGNDVIRCVCTGSHVTGSAQPVGAGSGVAIASGSDEIAEDFGYAELEDVVGEMRGSYTNYLYETLHKTALNHEEGDSLEATC